MEELKRRGRVEAPIPAPLAGELQEFWKGIFGFSAEHPPDVAPEVFLGTEVEHNRLHVYLERRGATLAGTCTHTVHRLWRQQVSRAVQRLAHPHAAGRQRVRHGSGAYISPFYQIRFDIFLR